jgi:hypothetical protein
VEKSGQQLQLETSGTDACLYSLSLKRTVDSTGRAVMKQFADLNLNWQEMEWLARDADSKRKVAFERITQSDFKFAFDPRRLLADYLRNRTWGDVKFMELKRHHFEVQAYFLMLAKKMLANQEELYSNHPGAREYADPLDNLLMRAFRSSDNWIANYLRFVDCCSVDLEDHVVQSIETRQHLVDLFKMLAARGTPPGLEGSRHLLDVYRRLSEVISPLMTLLSNAICIVENRPLPDRQTGFSKRWQIVRDSAYADLADGLDPVIRHCESHAWTRIDSRRRVVVLTETDASGKRVPVREYTYVEISKMTHHLQEVTYPTLLFGCYFAELVTATIILFSSEYVHLLLSIGNLKNEAA